MRPEPRRTRGKAAQPSGSLRARIVALAKKKRPSLVAFIDSLPPGTRTKEDIDRQFEELRGSSYSGRSTLTIPARIEDGRVILDAVLPPDIESAEVRVQVRAHAANTSSVARFLEALPPGDRTADNIDAQLREGRGDPNP